MSTLGHKLFFLEQLCVSRKCALLSRNLCLGTIHKRRRRFFWIFDTPLLHVDIFLVLSVGNFDQFLTPPSLPIEDVVYWRPLRVSSVCTIFLGLYVPFSKSLLCTHLFWIDSYIFTSQKKYILYSINVTMYALVLEWLIYFHITKKSYIPT